MSFVSLRVAAAAVFSIGLGTSATMAQTTGAANPCSGTGVTQIELKPSMPTYFSPASRNQTAADCFAWQQFIALNWKADPRDPGSPDLKAPPSSFGEPGDHTAKVWESFLTAKQVFTQSADKIADAWMADRSAVRRLERLSKLGDAVVDLDDIGQAGNGRWLTDQRGGLAYYEVLLNQDEYEYITGNVFAGADLTTYAGQRACASQPGEDGRGGFSLPAGNASGNTDFDCLGNPATYGKNVGAIEIKAAWVTLPADGKLNYRYKTAAAELKQPDGKYVQVTVGLVGMHIIHKVPGANQFVWATFEHINNTPDHNGGKPAAPALPENPNQKPSGLFTFFDKNCDPKADTVYQCVPNKLPGHPCPIGEPPTQGCYPYSAPMQITRLTPVDAKANAVTGYAWSLLPPDSVYNYYRLIDVQWPYSSSPVAPQSTAPLSTGDMTPPRSDRIIANTTMETYMQAKRTCTDCHQHAHIARSPAQTNTDVEGGKGRRVLISHPGEEKGGEKTPNYASDFSFVFGAETRR